jgi:hypothetical protein
VGYYQRSCAASRQFATGILLLQPSSFAGLRRLYSIQSCKTKPAYKKEVVPVPPCSLKIIRLLNIGDPTVSFSTALAGITLAEEANMLRLSLMCEVAASQLVNCGNAVDALAACETHKQLKSNPRLFSERPPHILSKVRGVNSITKSVTRERASC